MSYCYVCRMQVADYREHVRTHHEDDVSADRLTVADVLCRRDMDVPFDRLTLADDRHWYLSLADDVLHALELARLSSETTT